MVDILKKSLRDLLGALDDPRCATLLKIYDDYQDLFHMTEGSSHNHQAWGGGYADHIAECLRVNEITYDALSQLRTLPFTKASAAIVLFFHDIEKPFKYGPEDDPRCAVWQNKQADTQKDWEEMKWDILQHFCAEYGLVLSADEQNGLKYTHGEGDDHRKDARVSCPLAAHAHHCDNTSARIWFDEGRGLSAA